MKPSRNVMRETKLNQKQLTTAIISQIHTTKASEKVRRDLPIHRKKITICGQCQGNTNNVS